MSGTTLTIGSIENDTDFTLDGVEYKLSSGTLYRISGNTTSVYSGNVDVASTGSITVAELDGNYWGNRLEVNANGELYVTDSIENLTNAGDSVLVVSSDLSKVYGLLTKTDDGYSLSKTDSSNEALSLISVSSAKLEMESAFGSVAAFGGNSARFSELSLDSNSETFTIDATNTTPAISADVKSFTLTQCDKAWHDRRHVSYRS